LADAIRSLLKQGEKITAIKLYRQQTGFGLADDKAAVERIEKGEKRPNADAPTERYLRWP
jgi:ribosomal protein L7/L12